MTQIDSFPFNLTKIKDSIEQFPLKCKLFLNLLLSTINKASNIQIPKDFKKNYETFTLIFKKLSSDEKGFFISQLFQHIQTIFNSQSNRTNQPIHQIETSCEIKSALLGLSYWEKRNFKYSYRSNQVRLFTSKKQDALDLKHYLMRKSKSQRDSIVLEAISNEIPAKWTKVTIKFSNISIFTQIYNNLRKAIIEVVEKKMETLLNEEIKDRKVKKRTEDINLNKGFIILTTKIMTDYFNLKEKMIEKLNANKPRPLLIHNKNNTKVYRSSENKSYYYLQQNIQSSDIGTVKEGVMILNEAVRHSHYSCQVLETFAQNITANYYKMYVNQKQYEFVVIVQKYQREGSFHQIMKAATNFFLDISIQFVAITIKQIDQSNFTLQLNAILNFHSKKKQSQNTQGQAVNLLLEMVKPNWDKHIQAPDCYRKTCFKKDKEDGFNSIRLKQQQKSNFKNFDFSLQKNSNLRYQQHYDNSSGQKSQQKYNSQEEQKQQQLFFTIRDLQQQGMELQIFHSFQDKILSRKSIEVVQKRISKSNFFSPTQATMTNESNYLKVQPFNKPLPKSQLKRLKEHYLFGVWKKSLKGGVICIDEQVINRQKKILKLVFTRLGNNIFKGSGIMNTSLPVQLFKTESSLVSIARNLTYSPILIEPTVQMSPLQRMKNIILFEISMSALCLSTQKPFNPILGETYQGQINGCPVFLQQITHHPPVSSILMYGRGYRISGSVLLQVCLRLNYVRGVNDRLMTIEYDNGDKLVFSLPVMLINGLILGERSIYYDGTIYIADQRNNLITEITYNYNSKKGMFSFKNQNPDCLSGQIYQVSPAFMQKFIASGRKLTPKKDQQNKVVSTVNGEWNGKIFIDDALAYDFEQQLPVHLENCYSPLPSDSIFRTDVIELINGDMNIAQEEKDKLQENQRRDKKLRTANKSPKKIK